MNKDLSILTMIRLDTELENCLGHMADAEKKRDFAMFLTYEHELNEIMNEIETLGEKQCLT